MLNSPANYFIKALRSFGFLKIFVAFISVLTIPIIARLASQEDFGLIQYYVSVVAVLTSSIFGWNASSRLRFESQDTSENSWVSIVSNLFFSVSLFLVAGVLVLLEHYLENIVFSWFLLFWVVFVGRVNIALASLRARNRTKAYAVFSAMSPIGVVVGLVIFRFLKNTDNFGLPDFLLVMVFATGFTLITYLLYSTRSAFRVSFQGLSLKSFTAFAGYGAPLVIVSGAMAFIPVSVKTIVLETSGLSFLGLFSMGYDFSERIFGFVNSVFSLATGVAIYRAYDTRHLFIESLAANFRLFVLLVTPFLLTFCLTSEVTARILFDKENSDVQLYLISGAVFSYVIGIFHKYTIALSALKKVWTLVFCTASFVVIVSGVVFIVSFSEMFTSFLVFAPAFGAVIATLLARSVVRVWVDTNFETPRIIYKYFICVLSINYILVTVGVDVYALFFANIMLLAGYYIYLWRKNIV